MAFINRKYFILITNIGFDYVIIQENRKILKM